MGHWRNIVVDGTAWRYRVGSKHVEARHPGRPKLHAPNHTIVGVSVEVYERGTYKRTSDCAVTPGRIAEWIRREQNKQ